MTDLRYQYDSESGLEENKVFALLYIANELNEVNSNLEEIQKGFDYINNTLRILVEVQKK